VTIDSQTSPAGRQPFLICRLSVKNIGTSKIPLLRAGTGFKLSRCDQPQGDYLEPSWAELKVFDVLINHAWIESGETIDDEFLVRLPDTRPRFLLAESRLVCKRRVFSNVTVYNRKILTLVGRPT
jgi:hypothetical protein